MLNSPDPSIDAFCNGASSLFRLSIFSVALIIIGTAVVVSTFVVSTFIVVVVDVVDESCSLVVVLLSLLFIVVVGIDVVTVVLVTVLLMLLEVKVVVDGISGTKCNGGAGLGRRPTHLSHITPPLDDSPSPRKISVNN